MLRPVSSALGLTLSWGRLSWVRQPSHSTLVKPRRVFCSPPQPWGSSSFWKSSSSTISISESPVDARFAQSATTIESQIPGVHPSVCRSSTEQGLARRHYSPRSPSASRLALRSMASSAPRFMPAGCARPIAVAHAAAPAAKRHPGAASLCVVVPATLRVVIESRAATGTASAPGLIWKLPRPADGRRSRRWGAA